jgi:hypothetical protein
MASKARKAARSAGPARWAFSAYTIRERMTPRGRRHVVLSPDEKVVAVCQTRKEERDAVFLADDGDGPEELFQLRPTSVPAAALAFEVVDSATGALIGEIRMREFKAEKKEEWLLQNRDGEGAGLVTKDISRFGVLQRVGLLHAFVPKTYQIHWGQAIMGTIHQHVGPLMAERMRVDLALDKKGAVDRRLVLGVAWCIQEGERLAGFKMAPARS